MFVFIYIYIYIIKFGKGTSPADGMALLGATVGYLSEGVSPRMVVATHFLELFEYNLMPDKKLLKCRMDYILPEEQQAQGYLITI
jgi:DNA mismatch repair ATPase MutS